MKQSTKLLSLVLALVMAFGCMSVIGNAALVKSEVSWDNIDDAQLNAEQVADLALDLVDNDLLAGMEPIDLSIVGTLRLDSIDHICADVTTLTNGFIWGVGKGLLGDLGDLDFGPIKNKSRSQGDLNMIMNVLELVGNDNNSKILSKAAYGLSGSPGISLGLVSNFLDLGEIGDMLNDIPALLTGLLYDLLVYGSYGHDENLEELGGTLPTDLDTVDEIAMQAIAGLLKYPQDYTWEGEGDAAKKVWNEKSLVLPTVAKYDIAVIKDYFDINGSKGIAGVNETGDWDGDNVADQNNFFQLLDKIAPFAIYDLGVGALNNNLKKALLEAVEVEFNEIDVSALPADIATDFEVDAVDGEESYITYIAYDRIAQDGDDFYYTTLETETVMVDGKPQVDEDGNEVTERVRKYFKANTATANDFYQLIDFGWEFVAPEPFTEQEDAPEYAIDNISALNYKALIAEYGSIMESLNHLLYVVFETAVKQEVKDYFAEMTGDYWVDGATTEKDANGKSIFMDNASRLLKYLLAEHADKLFGSDSPYVAWEYDDIADYELLDIIAIIGPVFFEDVMPQLIMPKNADGTYAFHEGVQVLEFGALVIREFITEIAPNVNYDQYIFAEGTVTSANDRQFKEQNAEAWFNIILNMGVDIGYTYLNNITNFNTAIPEQGITEARWKGMLNDAIIWAAEYVSSDDDAVSLIHGFEPAKLKLAEYEDPLDKLSYILNTLLPLGFICGCTTDNFAFDVSVVFNKLKSLLTTFDLTEIASLFGRNDQAYNMLADDTLPDAVLKLVNNIVNLILPMTGTGVLLQGVGTGAVHNVISQANLKTTIQQLLNTLYTQGRDLLNCALPVVGMFIKGWGTEQQFNEPDISLSRSVDLTNGATAEAQTVTIRNASNGVWRHYRDAAGNEYTDEQYKIKLKSVAVYDEFSEGSTSAYVSTSGFTTDEVLDYGQTGTFQYTAANVPTDGKLVRFKVGYQVLDESGNAMAGGKTFYSESYTWLNYKASDVRTPITRSSSKGTVKTTLFSPHYVPISSSATYIPELQTTSITREYKLLGSGGRHDVAIIPANATEDGITFGQFKLNVGNGNHAWHDMTNFKTYTVKDSEDESDTEYHVDIAGGVAENGAYLNKKSGETTTFTINLKPDTGSYPSDSLVLRYYDDIAQSKLASLASSEMDAIRLASLYNLNGKVYAGEILKTENTTDDEGETVYRETAFADTAWIANTDAGKWAGTYTNADNQEVTETVTTYAESAVENKVEEKDENGKVIAAYGTVKVDGKPINVKKVTVIDCATAVNAYVPAFINGVRGGMQSLTASSVWNFDTLYETLYVASNDIKYCKKSDVQIVDEGNGDSIDAAVVALKTALANSEATYSDDYDYTDYKMYRWNRYNDARDDAAYYINLKNDASNATVAEIDERFPYTWIEEDDLKALVAGDDYENYIVALLEPLDEEEVKAKAQWLEDRKAEYQTRQLLDVEMASNYLSKMGPRLLKRDHGVITKYLDDEITSANNMVKAESNYTARSWAKYKAAMETALAVQANPTQMTVFDAKYELMCCRNELVLVENEADYSELEALIAQATQALANADLYDNTDKELGQVLAELGYRDFENADGDMVQLFPGSADYVNKEPYAVDQQDEIDQAAKELKEALARLKFKGLNITGANVKTEVIVPGDEEAGIADITASIARIAPELDAEAVKTVLGATATNANVSKDLITVSNDTHYTVDTKLEGLTGTNATVTFYTLVGGIKVPVATVKIVVEADVNGDGVLDVLDGALTELVANEHAELEGCYFIAANLDAATETIVAADYSAVVNKILA